MQWRQHFSMKSMRLSIRMHSPGSSPSTRTVFPESIFSANKLNFMLLLHEMAKCEHQWFHWHQELISWNKYELPFWCKMYRPNCTSHLRFLFLYGHCVIAFSMTQFPYAINNVVVDVDTANYPIIISLRTKWIDGDALLENTPKDTQRNDLQQHFLQ